MNDDEVLTAVRESFSDVQMRTPLEQTLRRGRILRTRRRIYRGAAAAGVAAVAAAAVLTTVSPTTPAKNTTLDAWTVTVSSDHTVNVTIRQLSDAAGLQQTLRNDGIPARVAFQAGEPSTSPPLPAGCTKVAMSDEANADLQGKILGTEPGMSPRDLALTLSPKAIPSGIGIYLAIERPDANGWGWSLALVQAAPSCTG
jgi:hypothetical protein